MTTNDPVTQKALRLIEEELEAIGFDIDALNREVATDMERMITLRERRRNLARLYRMHGGEPAALANDNEAVPA